MDEERQRDLVEQYVSAYNDFDVDGMAALLDEDVEFQNVRDGTVTASASGINEFILLAEKATVAFLRREQTILSFTSDGEQSARAQIAFTGTLANDVPGLGEVGDDVSMMGQTEFEFTNGTITAIRDHS